MEENKENINQNNSQTINNISNINNNNQVNNQASNNNNSISSISSISQSIGVSGNLESIELIQEEQLNEGVTKEQLIQILKEKVKEIKTVNTKLSKLEQKYVKTYKESKATTKDRETFYKLLKHIFNEDPYKMQDRETGQYEFEELKKMFESREDDKRQSMLNMISELTKEKMQLELLYNQKLGQQVSNMDLVNQQLVATLKSQKQDIEQNSTKLAKEIVELNDIISEKNSEIDRLKKADDEFQSFKAEILLKELHSAKSKTNDDVYKRIRESDKQNEILKIKNQLDNAYDQIYKLEKQNKEMKQQIQQFQNGANDKQNKQFTSQGVQTTLFVSNQQQYQKTNNNYNNSNVSASEINQSSQQSNLNQQELQEPDIIIYQKSQNGDNELLEEQKFIQDNKRNQLFQNQQSQNNSKNSQNLSISPSFIRQNSEQSSISISKFDDDLGLGNINLNVQRLNSEYLKNVVLKYFVYQESKNYKEAQILMSAILTILRMTPDERRKIEQAREYGSLWTTTKTWLTWSKYRDVDFPKTGSGGSH